METFEHVPGVHERQRKMVIVAVIILLLIIAGMFVFAYLKKGEQIEVATEPEETQEETPYDYITRVDGTHYFIDGVHTVVGEIPMPTPCDLLETDSTVQESYPEQIIIDFSVINNADICAQVITPARFKVSVTASEEATIGARFMGRPVELNLKPAPEGETPDEFEIFLKG